MLEKSILIIFLFSLVACKPRDNRISLESIQSTVDSIKNSEKKKNQILYLDIVPLIGVLYLKVKILL